MKRFHRPTRSKAFAFGSDPDGLTGNWYNLAGVSDGTR